MQNLSEQQANRLVTRLDDDKIESQKKRQADGRWSVEVERDDLAHAMREMEQMRLLRESSALPQEASSVISNRDQQRFTFERALSAEIEQTLLSINGVLEARVHLNLPQVDPLFGKIVPGARGGGSVFLIAENQMSTNAPEIARLVAGAAGIEGDSVSVLIEVESRPEVKPAETSEVGAASSEASIYAHLGEARDFALQNAPFFIGGMLVLIGLMLLWKVMTHSRKRIAL